MEALAKFPQFTGASEGEWVAWLRLIVIHHAQDTNKAFHDTDKRDVGREIALSDRVAAQLLMPVKGETRMEMLDRVMEVVESQRAALWRLTPFDQRVLWLYYMNEMSYEEVAASTGRSPRAIRMHCKRALQHWREGLLEPFKKNQVVDYPDSINGYD